MEFGTSVLRHRYMAKEDQDMMIELKSMMEYKCLEEVETQHPVHDFLGHRKEKRNDLGESSRETWEQQYLST